MIKTTYSGKGMTTQVLGLKELDQVLGELAERSPGAARDAINRTATRARHLMIDSAKLHYALTIAGQRHLKDLKRTKRASTMSLWAELRISTPKNDLGYFEHTPTQGYTGQEVFRKSPQFYQGKVLRENPLKPLTGGGIDMGRAGAKNGSKGFVMIFPNDGDNAHHGMVQRIIGSSTSATKTKSGKPRWRNAQGKVEKLATYGSPSASAMHHVMWNDVEPEVEKILLEQLDRSVLYIINKYKKKAKIL